MKAVTGLIVASLILINLCGMGRSEPLSLRASAVDLHADNDQIRRVGGLKYQGGLNLTSLDPRFGGLSGLAISADGRRLGAVTDRGDWVHFRPTLSSTGQLTGITAAQIGDLLNLDGKPLRKKRDSDAESLIPIDGGFAVSFEHRHRLWLYRAAPNPFRARPTEITLPAISRAMPPNTGVEALARLRDGRLIAIAEDFPKDAPFAQGWIFEKIDGTGFVIGATPYFYPPAPRPCPTVSFWFLKDGLVISADSGRGWLQYPRNRSGRAPT